MGASASERDDAVLWDITRPARHRLPGVTMAGFGDRGMTPSELRLIPHPAVTLHLVFDGAISADDTAGRRLQGSFTLGVGFGGVMQLARTDAFQCLQVRLSPTVARAALGGAVAELDSTAATLDALCGRDAAHLTDRLSGLSTWEERFRLAEEWLAGRCASAEPVAPEIDWAWRQTISSRGETRIEHLAAELGWSRKRLWSQFRSHLGVSPKRAAKLVRFDHAVHQLAAGEKPALTAADTGYTDQSHLHRDVVDFAGVAPAAVHHEPFLAVDDIAWGWPSRRRRLA